MTLLTLPQNPDYEWITYGEQVIPPLSALITPSLTQLLVSNSIPL